MIELMELLRDDGTSVAQAWQPTLGALAAEHGERVPDWGRVFPGLIALVGFQSILWPLWVSTVAATSERAPMTYTAPTAEPGQPVWRFAYQSVADHVAWALAGGPGLVEFARAQAILQQRDVVQTLASLDERGKVVLYGSASLQLLPLLGRRLSGEADIGLPICDCQEIATMLPDWRDGVEPLRPVLARAADRLAQWRQGERTGAPGLSDEEGLRLGYACLAWHVWRALQDAGCFRAGASERPKGFGLLKRQREPAPFNGVLLLRGDHWELWRKVKQLIRPAEMP